MSQNTLDHGTKHRRISWWYILFAVVVAIVLVLADRNYYSIIIKYEFNNLTENTPSVVDFKIQNNTGDINDISLEKKYIYKLNLDHPSTERLFRGGKFFINLSQPLKKKLAQRFDDKDFLMIADYKNLSMIEIDKFAMSYIDHIRTWAGNEALARQLSQDSSSSNIEFFQVEKISKEQGCNCNFNNAAEAVKMINIQKCQCLLRDIFYKRRNNVNYLMYCPPEFSSSPNREYSCEVRAQTNYYTARFYIKRDFLTDFDDLATFLLNRFKLI